METAVTENGVEISVKENHDKPTTCSTFYNPVMKICREFVLCCLATHLETLEKGPLKCLDGFGATGIGGLQWKRHLGDGVAVTINDKDPDALQEIVKNVEKNGFKVFKSSADDRVASSRPEVVDDDRVRDHVEVSEGDCNVILHQRQFSFIHLDPYGCTVQYLDGAFRNIYNHGVMVITATDVAALYGKNPQVTMRNYNAYTVKTDYTKEMAARILIAAATRSAARCNKGFSVLYSVSVEHFVQVALYVHRGAATADKNLGNVRRILHCQLCEEWAEIPDSRAPLENPYSLMPCSCREETPGKTAVILGPMWMGPIYSPDFTSRMKSSAVRLRMSERVISLLNTIHEESVCADLKQRLEMEKIEQAQKAQGALDTEVKSALGNQKDAEKQIVPQKTENQSSEQTQNSDFLMDSGKMSETAKSEPSNENSSSAKVDLIQNGKNSVTTGVKRAVSDVEGCEAVVRKKLRLGNDGDRADKTSGAPLFFYNPTKRKIKGINVPKAHKLVLLMQREGFRASRTHFDPLGIRTDATLRELKEILNKHHSNT